MAKTLKAEDAESMQFDDLVVGLEKDHRELSNLILSKYLKECSGIILLADKFGKDEKMDLNQKFKECCERRDAK